jgi:threonine synthase
MAYSCISCQGSFPLTENLNTCSKCGGLLDVVYEFGEARGWPDLWRSRRGSWAPADASGVFRFRELLPFLNDLSLVATLGEGNTPLLASPVAAEYARLPELRFKHQGYNPTGSFKDNGMVAAVARARQLGMRLVACVSTGNTSASMAAYAAAAGLRAVVFVPRGEIALGKLAQALEYGAVTLEVEGNFDAILKLVFAEARQWGVYLLNSVNPFRLEGQKTIMAELLEQLGWDPPEWIVVPGGNLGNVSAFGKGLRELLALGLIPRLPRLAVIQAEGAAPLFHMLRDAAARLTTVAHPETLATAIKIGAPVSWPKAVRELRAANGVCEIATEQEIADAKAVIGRAGIGCEPASAATLAGIRKLAARGVIARNARVVAVLTGHLLKDPEYILRYHSGTLELAGRGIAGAFANRPRPAPAEAGALRQALEDLLQ